MGYNSKNKSVSQVEERHACPPEIRGNHQMYREVVLDGSHYCVYIPPLHSNRQTVLQVAETFSFSSHLLDHEVAAIYII